MDFKVEDLALRILIVDEKNVRFGVDDCGAGASHLLAVETCGPTNAKPENLAPIAFVCRMGDNEEARSKRLGDLRKALQDALAQIDKFEAAG